MIAKVQHMAGACMRHTKYLASDLAGSLGMHNRFLRQARGGRILAYHGVCESHPLRYNTLFITKKRFEEHLQLYRQYCHIISLDDFFHERFIPGKFNIALSFDDGFANNHRFVWPLLEKYAAPATFFITAIRDAGYDILWNDFLTINTVHGPRKWAFGEQHFRRRSGNTYVLSSGHRSLPDLLRDEGFHRKQRLMQAWPSGRAFFEEKVPADYWLQMSAGQIREVASSPLVTIGSHGYYHNDLGRISTAGIREELSASKRFLERVTGKPVTQLAFPYGSYRLDTIREALHCGYEQLYATEFCLPPGKHHRQVRERMGINPFISSLNQLLAVIKGHYA